MDADAETSLGVVIPFPLHKVRNCMDCEHCYAGPHGLYCGMFKEPIYFEDVAEGCGEFEPI